MVFTLQQGARHVIAWIGLGAAIVWGAAVASPAAQAAEGKVSPPNIVVLFSDDAGYADFGFQGSRQMKTPHLDRLAADGVRFTQFYMTASVCGPSRAGLMTGRYQQRFGFEENNVPGIMSPNSAYLDEEMGLPTNLRTMADYLHDLGYRTAAFGKWHLGGTDRYHPTKRGFDEFYGFRGGARSYFAYRGAMYEQAGSQRWLERGFRNFEEPEKYLTAALADEACAFIERNRDRPFFAYVAFNAVHLPMQVDSHDADAFSELEGKRRTLAQMNLALDRACGRIIEKLKEAGVYENTLIVFTNDNGGPSDRNASCNYPFAGVKATLLEGGIRVPCVMTWPNRLPKGVDYDEPASALDLLPTFVSAAGGVIPADAELDGVDLLPYLLGEKQGRPHETLYWKKDVRAAIRDGDWKLLRYPDRPAELFNLAEDPGEQHNLAATHPEIVQRLFKKLFAWEVTLERPMFMLRQAEEQWAAERTDQFRKPPAAEF